MVFSNVGERGQGFFLCYSFFLYSC
jgi:hypothetical protein